MFENREKEEIFFLDTEKSGKFYDLETHKVIFDRYSFALKLCEGKRVLEVGCGSGLGLELLSNSCTSFDAIEYCERNIQLLRQKDVGKAKIIHGDAHQTNFRSHSFDLVIALAMIYYLNLHKFLIEVQRLLDQDGVLFFCTSNKDVPGFCKAPGTTEYYSVPELYSILTDMGFECEIFGAFPKPGGSLPFRQFKALMKNSIKKIFYGSKFGISLWDKMRTKRLGKKFQLPSKMTENDITSVETTLLNPNLKDYSHRVIYIVARKK